MKDYIVTSAKEVGEPDQYGNKAFSVFFENETKPVFMKTKAGNEPTPGKTEYGVIEDAPKKSGEGTYRKFTRKQREEANVAQVANTGTATFTVHSDREASIQKQSALKSAVATGETDVEKILKLADDFYEWLGGTGITVPEEPLPEPQGEEEIDLDDIPF